MPTERETENEQITLPDRLRQELQMALLQSFPNSTVDDIQRNMIKASELYKKLLRVRLRNPTAMLTDHSGITGGVTGIIVSVLNEYQARSEQSNTVQQVSQSTLPDDLRQQLQMVLDEQAPLSTMISNNSVSEQYQRLLTARESDPGAMLAVPDNIVSNRTLTTLIDILNNYNPAKPTFEEDDNNYTESTSIGSLTHKENSPEHCINDSLTSLELYTNEDKPILLYILNSQDKYEKALCITRDELLESIKSDLDVFPPRNFMTIFTSPADSNVAGYGSKPTGKIVFKLPVNNIFITLGSLEILLSNVEKEFYIIPLYNGKRRRVGNLKGIFGASMNHAQVPGFVINKLYTRSEINSDIVVKESHNDYPKFICDNMTPLVDLGIDVTTLFTNNLLNSLLRM
jgi:hypothetical protein